jgi:hypothetical protein
MVVLETDQLSNDLRIFKKCKFVFPDFITLSDTRVLIEIIIAAQGMFIQDTVNYTAPVAAERLVIICNWFATTGFTAMETNNGTTGRMDTCI